MKNLTFKEIVKYCNIINKGKIRCKCGHTMAIPPHLNKAICHWCNNYVFKTKKDEFEYRMKEAMKREVENKNNK